MSTKAGAIEVSGRPAWFMLWTAVVSVLAAAALIMSAVALTEARSGGGSGAADSQTLDVASSQAPLWDAGKLDAMRGRVLAGTISGQGYALWDAGKLEAMQGRVVAG